jgi:hypothetical protein
MENCISGKERLQIREWLDWITPIPSCGCYNTLTFMISQADQAKAVALQERLQSQHGRRTLDFVLLEVEEGDLDKILIPTYE